MAKKNKPTMQDDLNAQAASLDDMFEAIIDLRKMFESPIGIAMQPKLKRDWPLLYFQLNYLFYGEKERPNVK